MNRPASSKTPARSTPLFRRKLFSKFSSTYTQGLEWYISTHSSCLSKFVHSSRNALSMYETPGRLMVILGFWDLAVFQDFCPSAQCRSGTLSFFIILHVHNVILGLSRFFKIFVQVHNVDLGLSRFFNILHVHNVDLPACLPACHGSSQSRRTSRGRVNRDEMSGNSVSSDISTAILAPPPTFNILHVHNVILLVVRFFGAVQHKCS